MKKIFTNLWFWVVMMHVIVVLAWSYLKSITPEPKYTPPAESAIESPEASPAK